MSLLPIFFSSKAQNKTIQPMHLFKINFYLNWVYSMANLISLESQDLTRGSGVSLQCKFKDFVMPIQTSLGAVPLLLKFHRLATSLLGFEEAVVPAIIV